MKAEWKLRHECAMQAMTLVNAYIEQERDENWKVETKANDSDFVTNVDKGLENKFRQAILSQFPDDIVLGEETFDKDQAIDHSHVWVIDPIDGTTNFIKLGYDYGVLVSYYENGQGILGYMYNPETRDLYYAIQGAGAFLNGEAIKLVPETTLSESLVSIRIQEWEDLSGANELVKKANDIRYYGCGMIDSIKVIRGELGAFVNHRNGPWDMAAQLIFAKELGLIMTHFDGSPIHYLSGGNQIFANKGCYDEIQVLVQNIETNNPYYGKIAE